ncbi:hypothetical protein LJB42_000962 [Komagataella kurtzmanii]|nr:hypothetical protein LJB42_000962 [Komagataella kurtzmanii]
MTTPIAQIQLEQEASKNPPKQHTRLSDLVEKTKGTKSWVSPFRTDAKAASPKRESYPPQIVADVEPEEVDNAEEETILDHDDANATVDPIETESVLDASDISIKGSTAEDNQEEQPEPATDVLPQDAEEEVADKDTQSGDIPQDEGSQAEQEEEQAPEAQEEQVSESQEAKEDDKVDNVEAKKDVADKKVTKQTQQAIKDTEEGAKAVREAQAKLKEAELKLLKEPVVITPDLLQSPAEDDAEKTLKEKPLLLNRYKQNKEIAENSLQKKDVENPDQVVDLGGGLLLTQAQIYSIAQARVEPLLGKIDKQVDLNLKADELKKRQTEQQYHEQKDLQLSKNLEKYQTQLTRENNIIVARFDTDIAALSSTILSNATLLEEFATQTRKEIDDLGTKALAEEEKLAEEHETNKTKLEENAKQYKEDLETKLLNATTGQEDEKTKIEELKVKVEEEKAIADDLEEKASDKNEALNAKRAELDELVAEEAKLQATVDESEQFQKECDAKAAALSVDHTKSTKKLEKLQSHVSALGSAIEKHASKIGFLTGAAVASREVKRKHNESSKSEWLAEKARIRSEVAKANERKTLEAELERERLAKEKEIERQQKEEQYAQEKLDRAEEEKRLKEDVAELQRVKQLKKEKSKLSKKLASTGAFFAGGVATGAAIGAATGAAAGSAAGAAASGAGAAASGASKVVSSSTNTASQGASDAEQVGNGAKKTADIRRNESFASNSPEIKIDDETLNKDAKPLFTEVVEDVPTTTSNADEDIKKKNRLSFLGSMKRKASLGSKKEPEKKEPATGVVPASSSIAKDNDDGEYEEVSTLETISDAEYEAHKDDPNYFIVDPK